MVQPFMLITQQETYNKYLEHKKTKDVNMDPKGGSELQLAF